MLNTMNLRIASTHYVLAFIAICVGIGCSDNSDSESAHASLTDAASASSSVDAGMPPATTQLGTVDFVPVYETDSAWMTSDEARQMVDGVFAQFEALIRTSGAWNATIEVYLTDDNPGFANTSFDETFSETTLDGQNVLVVPAWKAIVTNTPVEGAAFAIHFNVTEQADNAGLLRHEMMHGLGAVNRLGNFTLSIEGPVMGPMPGDEVHASLYDVHLVDLEGSHLLSQYDEITQRFIVQPYQIETELTDWMDGAGGVSFRGIADDGSPLDMGCGTFPAGENTGALVLNEPSDVMSAGVHPSWNTIAEPDRAFLRAMRYTLNEE